MEDPDKNYLKKKKKKKKKKAITIVMFMSKKSYWEGVKLTAENEILFNLPRTMDNNRIQIFSDEFRKILFTHYTPVIKEYIVFG